MATVTILWSLCAVVATMLAGACGFVWLIERRNLASLMFCILGFAAAASGYQELGMMHSATTAEYGEWLRWYHLPIFVTIVGQLLFVHYYLETGRSWLMWVVVAIRSAVLVVNFSVHPNFNFSNIASLDHISLLGEQVSAIGVAVPRIQWQWFASLSLILWLVYLADAAAQRWLQGGRDSRHKALAVILGIGGPLLCSVVYTRLLVYGAWHGPTTNLPWFLGALIMMAYELGRDVILSRRARLESAELRDQLARAERVSMLGQLSSALAHELTQPLNAVLLNVEAAQAHLRRDQPDLDDLRAILADTGRDGLRAAEIVARVRQLLKRGAVELRPVSVETIVPELSSNGYSPPTESPRSAR